MYPSGETGKKGETLAADYYRNRGFVVLDTNWRHSYYEIDLVASKGTLLHIVEVKTRRSDTYGYPEEAVDRNKLYRLLKAGVRYMSQHPEWKYVQYDVLSIFLEPDKQAVFFLLEDVYI
jgi:putative endonuclease